MVNGLRGGVAVAIHKSFNCAQAKACCNAAGEWLRIRVGPIQVISAYRQPNAIADTKKAWNEPLAEDLAALGAAAPGFAQR